MAENNNNNMSGKDFLIGALVGGIIGAASALLLTPKSGRELRGDISDGYQVASKKTQELAKNLGGQTEAIVSKVKEVSSHVKDDIQKWTTDTTEKLKEVKEDVTDKAVELKDEAAATYDDVMDSVDSALEKAKRKSEENEEK